MENNTHTHAHTHTHTHIHTHTHTTRRHTSIPLGISLLLSPLCQQNIPIMDNIKTTQHPNTWELLLTQIIRCSLRIRANLLHNPWFQHRAPETIPVVNGDQLLCAVRKLVDAPWS